MMGIIQTIEVRKPAKAAERPVQRLPTGGAKI